MMTHGLQTDITVLFYNGYTVKNKISSGLEWRPMTTQILSLSLICD